MNCSSFQVQHLFNCDNVKVLTFSILYSIGMLIPFLTLTLDSKTDCAHQHIASHIRYLLQKFKLHLLVAVQLKSTKLSSYRHKSKVSLSYTLYQNKE